MMRLFNIYWSHAGLGALLLLVLFFASYKLDQSPPTWYDEGLYIQVAQSLAETGAQSIQVAPGERIATSFITGGYPFLAPVAASMWAFGETLFAARLPMVLFMLAMAFVLYTIVRRVARPLDALQGLLLVATCALFYGNGKNVLGEVPGLFYVGLSLYALSRLEDTQYQGLVGWAFVGFSLGLAAATKPIFLLAPVAVAVVLLFHIRHIPLRLAPLGAGLVAFVLPLLVWVQFQFGWGSDMGVVLSHYMNPYAVENVGNIVWANIARLFTETTPFYALAACGVWALSFVVRVWRRRHIRTVEWSVFLFVVLVMLAYTRTAGWYRYLFPALVLALAFVPHALRECIGVLPIAAVRTWLQRGAYVVFVLLAGVQVWQLSFSSWVADHYGSHATQEFEEYFEKFPPGSILVFDAPDMVPFLHTKNYYQYIQATPVFAYGTSSLLVARQGIPKWVIISPAMLATHKKDFSLYSEVGTIGSYRVLQKI